MPYTSQWVEPELAVEHGGVKVYHTYKNDDMEQGQRAYWFSTNELMGEYDGSPEVFDVRELRFEVSDEEVNRYPNDSAEIATIKQAIDKGLLTREGV